MYSGHVEKIVQAKGYAFLRSPMLDRDAFVMLTDVRGIERHELVRGMACEFDVEATARGLRAIDVIVL